MLVIGKQRFNSQLLPIVTYCILASLPLLLLPLSLPLCETTQTSMSVIPLAVK